ncbi:hypothetical protein GCM10025867_49970 (plasmid) [Frondihabitans sucicola]|uniref:GmrSD restriction endonucleases N-terminal domain-containing protein n=1 Tax=Frondihabitans sucicola TaxID=1268041 RepID=A0ABM8GWB7_9MICO|nr:DUF262 domain-containing protein [Frondihabitans sucicola]BDZ52756.1 hypothetical protein GCM10025867_49970 [Frondihabitans sucicola]
MTLQTEAPLEALALNIYNRPIEGLLRDVALGRTDLNPAYQRGSVWSEDQRRGLVKSFIVGLPVPALIINARWNADFADGGEYEYAVIDGKQRLEALAAFFDDNLSIPASWLPPQDVVTTIDTPDGAYVTYSGLSARRASRFKLAWAIPTVEAQLTTIREEAAMFQLVNTGGTPQTQTDLDRAAAVAQEA